MIARGPLTRRTQRRILYACVTATAGAALLLLRGPRVIGYTPGVEAASSDEITHDLARPAPNGIPDVAWRDVAADAGIAFHHFHGKRSTQLPEDMGSGVAWGDYDGDGDPDLFLVNESGPLTATAVEIEASPARSALYRNDGGRFTDVTTEAGVGARGLGMGAAWGDADGDGDLDLAVSRFGTIALYRNDGATFADVSRESGMGEPEGFWTGVSWGDYDRDGALDLYVCGYVRYVASASGASRMYEATVPASLNPSSFTPERNLLFHNEGRMRFAESAARAGVDNPSGRSLSAAWADFDGDLWPDLYVANDISDNAMYRNVGDGTFEDVSHSAWVADYRGAMGLAIGDWDGDLDLDIFITHWIAQENALYVNQKGNIAASPRDPLHFTDEADLVGLGQIALDYVGWGTEFLDYDNDARLDLLVVNGSTFQREDDASRLVPMKDLLFWNAGKAEGFFEAGTRGGAPFQTEHVGRGSACADYDGDGDVDCAIAVNGGDARLLQNTQATGHHFARLVLRGAKGSHFPASTTFANGALVTLRSSAGVQVRAVGGGPSYLSQSSPGEVHFGLAGASSIDRIEVAWPSGTTQSFENLPVDHTLRITEGNPAIEVAGAAPPARVARREDIRLFWQRLDEATGRRTRKDFAGAASAYEEALTIDPRHEDALYYLGQCRQELEQRPEARAAFDRLVLVNPRSARGHLALAALLASPDEGTPIDVSGAEEHLRSAHAINGEETGPIVRLGELLIVKGERGEAARLLEGAVRTNPKSVEARLLAGYLRYEAGDAAGAAALYRAAVAVAAPAKSSVVGEGDRKSSTPAPATPAPAPPLAATMGKTLFGDLAADVARRAEAGQAPLSDVHAVYAPLRARARALAARVTGPPQP